MQTDLFGTEDPRSPHRLGRSAVSYQRVKSILTAGSGFMSRYDFTLNPYSGCTFGCTYCYAAFFARKRNDQDRWGEWVHVKENALQLLSKEPPGSLDNKTIYMSSVTDPYQPIEGKLKLVRAILEQLIANQKPRLVVQTRSPMVTRDLDLLAQLPDPQVNMTVTTDREEVRRAFEPHCPSNKVRLRAIQAVQHAGLNACITLTPLLPIEDPHRFAQDLLRTGVQKFVIQPFHATRGRFVAGTRDQALAVIREMGWNNESYLEALDVLRMYIPNLREGKEGFDPE